MVYRIEFSSKVRDYMKKLPENISLRIVEKFRQLSKKPFRFLKHYEGKYYKFRIGNYRALIDIDFVARVLYVEVLDNRGRVYKNG